ncbi:MULTISPECIES: hypothetical protein [Bacillus]|uniref:hypothetical protein n=1 Tax=Bacillus TaxID=1386 RepID=UPI001B12656C|nr:hypothetical protein [Bacillus sonorensis]GIN68483.1 hypothetical protein J41TS2_39040 [Bacillus sonorensis]
MTIGEYIAEVRKDESFQSLKKMLIDSISFQLDFMMRRFMNNIHEMNIEDFKKIQKRSIQLTDIISKINHDLLSINIEELAEFLGEENSLLKERIKQHVLGYLKETSPHVKSVILG